MVENVKVSSANVRWYLKTLGVARAQNINSVPRNNLTAYIRGYFDHEPVIKNSMKPSNHLPLRICHTIPICTRLRDSLSWMETFDFGVVADFFIKIKRFYWTQGVNLNQWYIFHLVQWPFATFLVTSWFHTHITSGLHRQKNESKCDFIALSPLKVLPFKEFCKDRKKIVIWWCKVMAIWWM